VLLVIGPQDAHQDHLGDSPVPAAISAVQLPVDHYGANGLLRRPVGRINLRSLQEQEQGVAMIYQMLGQPLIRLVGEGASQQPADESFVGDDTQGGPMAGGSKIAVFSLIPRDGEARS
jgi:hypothetical protein